MSLELLVMVYPLGDRVAAKSRPGCGALSPPHHLLGGNPRDILSFLGHKKNGSGQNLVQP